MPMMFAPILVGFQFKWFFNDQVGLVNNLLFSLTGEAHIIPWLVDRCRSASSPSWWPRSG